MITMWGGGIMGASAPLIFPCLISQTASFIHVEVLKSD